MSNFLDSNYENPIDSPGFLLWQVTNLWQKKIKSKLKTLDLTHVQFVLLAACSVLDDTNEQITQSVLSQFTKTDVMMTSQVLRTLENKGLVERKIHPNDTRAKVLHVTDKGRALAKEANIIVEDTDKKFFLKLEDNQHTFTLLLQELSQND
ncbi:MarR family winged helix-turn-helix transcriptional regulator [Peribacillus sp. NPDC096448]|uniref:MarR family winged helix-turn-helix transcriptional regulator n=1 Tax=Peribacillus sp. NPDC096448 TaxID=3364395 RepID=UPI0037F674C5